MLLKNNKAKYAILLALSMILALFSNVMANSRYDCEEFSEVETAAPDVTTCTPFLHTDSATICDNKSYLWRGQDIKNMTAGTHIFYDSLKTQDGCDSIYQLILTVKAHKVEIITPLICYGYSYYFAIDGNTYLQPGTYSVFKNLNDECEQEYRLIISVNPSYNFYDTVTLCDNETFTWRDVEFFPEDADEDIQDILKTTLKCDSIYHLTLRVSLSYFKTETDTICDGETYWWHGKSFTTPGTYYDSLSTQTHGCDSIFQLILTVKDSYSFKETHTMCSTDTLQWHGLTLSQSGTYYDSSLTAQGCDSIYELVLTVNQAYHFMESDTICDNDTLIWHGQSLSTSGIYYDSLKTQANCDSIYEISIISQKNILHPTVVSICDGQTYYYAEDGNTYSQSGTYTIVKSMGNRCNDEFQLTLTVNPVYNFYDTAEMCDNDIHTWRNNTYQGLAPGKYQFHDSLQTYLGCDSVYHLTLTVLKSYTFVSDDTICSNQSIKWHGQTLNQAKTYFAIYSTQDGCDSIYQLNLAVMKTYFFQEYDTICDNQPLNWHGQTLNAAGTYHDSLKSVFGCDSVHWLTLTVHNTYFFQEFDTICDKDMRKWHGKQLTVAGTYYDSLTSSHGCDSIYQLNLYVQPIYKFTENDTICDNQSLPWHGQTLKKADTYFAIYTTQAGCDSIYQIDLAVMPSFFFQEYDTICDNQSLQWHGQTLTTAGRYFDSLSTVFGCDSVYWIDLTVHKTYFFQEYDTICDNQALAWHGQTLTTAGRHFDSLTTANGCDSVYWIDLTVNNTYFFQQYDTICDNQPLSWHGQTLTTAKTYHDSLKTVFGCDSVYWIDLTVHQTYFFQEYDTICDNQSLTWHGQTLTTAKTYFDSLTTGNGCDSVYWIDLTVHPTYFFQEYDTICDNQSLPWHGQTLSAAGRYYDSLSTGNGCDSVYWLDLTVHQTYFFQQYDTICDNQPLAWHGQTLSVAGTYFDSLTTGNGCDSVYRIDLTTKQSFYHIDYDTITDKDSVIWHNLILKQTGVYFDSAMTVEGCDSIYEMDLIVNPTFFFPSTDTICNGDTAIWRNMQLTVSGLYYDSLKTIAGDDSIYLLTLTVHPTYDIYEQDTICDNQSLTWHGQTLTIAGFYHDTLQTANGCDSLHTIELTVTPTFFFQEYDTICDNQSKTWHGQSLTATGRYFDSLSTVFGCDSVYWLDFTVHPTYFFQEYDTICDNQSLPWHGQTLTTAGTYFDSLTTGNGCDSVYRIDLTVHQTYFFHDYDTICDNLSLTWHGQTLTVAGTYYDSLMTINGCDSVYQIDLTTKQSFYSLEHDTIADTDSLIWHNQILKQTGIYFDSAMTVEGCDSIYEMNLIVNPTFFFQDYDTICNGDTSLWRNMPLTVAGTYYDSLKTVAGEDSIYLIILTVHPTYDIIEYDTICDNQSLVWHGQTLTAAGSYYDTLQTAEGCDSLHTIELTVTPTFFFQEYDTICDNQSLPWHGQTLTAAGTYHDSLMTINGCDSVYWIDLTVHPTYFFQQYDTICDNQPLAWHGQTLTTAGTYHDSLYTVFGCDSVYWIDLTVHPTYFFQEYDTICDNQSLTWHGQTLTTAGTYFDSLFTVNGCDSVYWIDLTVHQTYFFQEYDTICDNQSIQWHGQTLTNAGTYHDSLTTVFGCDSVYWIDLTVHQTYFFQQYDTICDNQSLAWHGQTLTTADTYHDSLTTVFGCDSVYWIDLTVHPTYFFQEYDTICDNQSIQWHGQTLTTAGTYHDSLLTVNGCDSVYWIDLTVHPTYFFQEYDTICDNHSITWHGQTLTAAGTYYDSLQTANGCDSIYRIDLYTHSSFLFQLYDTICDNQSLTWHGQTLTETGLYYDSLLTTNGCDSVYWLDLTVTPTFFFQEYDTVCSNNPLAWHGQTLTASGSYYDSLQSVHGCDSVYWIDLVVHQAYLFQYFDTICNQDTAVWRGMQFTQAGIYNDSLFTVQGCDSVYQLILHVHQTYFFHIYDTICDNQVLPWHGQILTDPGWYYDSLKTSNGCDSVYWLDLTIMPTYFFQEYDTICDNQPLLWHGQTLTAAGTYHDSLQSIFGCDSVYWIDLTVHDTYNIYDTVELCITDLPYHYAPEDTTLAPAQIGVTKYQFDHTTILGCDSVVYLQLIVYDTFSIHLYDTICQWETYTENGFNLEEQNDEGDILHQLSLQSVHGCDSTVLLHLYVKQSYDVQLYDVVCQGYTYHKDGFILPPQYQSGELTYQQFLLSQENCDSIITLNLSVTDLEVSITQVDGDLCEDGFVTLEVQTTLLDFVWSTGDTSRQITVDNSGWYTIHVEAGECAADAGFTIEPCTLELFIPNAFSPSRVDGINDEFYINWPALSNVEEFEINIYDRWGKLAFHSTDPHFKWDGKVNGKIPRNNVFTYKVFVLGRNGFDYVFKGTITVL